MDVCRDQEEPFGATAASRYVVGSRTHWGALAFLLPEAETGRGSVTLTASRGMGQLSAEPVSLSVAKFTKGAPK